MVLERAELAGTFAVGSTITMFQSGQDPIRLRIAEAAEPDIFVDEADFGDVIVRTTHRVGREGDRSRVTYATARAFAWVAPCLRGAALAVRSAGRLPT